MKKFLAYFLTVVLTATAAITGTLAYLQYEDSDVNVMTLGNVKIEQHEYQRVVNDDGTYATDTIDNRTSYVLEDFVQGKALLPATEVDANGNPYNFGAGSWDSTGTTVRMSQVNSYGGMEVFESKNAVDKFVTVENTGKTDAYVRTLVAIEVGSTTETLIATSSRGLDVSKVGTSDDDNSPWVRYSVGSITINNNNYKVMEYVYRGANDVKRHVNGILPAGQTTYPSLAQVYLAATATNEDMVAIDGNNNGTLDILVLSQAVQAEGFDDAKTALDIAFGKASEKAVEWFGGEAFAIPTAVATADELTAALTAGENVVLVNDIELTEAVTIDNAANLNLNGNTLSTVGLEFKNGGSLENGTIASGSDTNMVGHLVISGGNMEMNSVKVTVDNVVNANAAWTEAAGVDVQNATVTLNNCDISVSNNVSARWVFGYGICVGDSTVTVNGGSITVKCVDGTANNGPTNPYAISSSGNSTVTLNNVTVDATYYGSSANGVLTINTTDTAITSDKIVNNRNGSHNLNYIQ